MTNRVICTLLKKDTCRICCKGFLLIIDSKTILYCYSNCVWRECIQSSNRASERLTHYLRAPCCKVGVVFMSDFNLNQNTQIKEFVEIKEILIYERVGL